MGGDAEALYAVPDPADRYYYPPDRHGSREYLWCRDELVKGVRYG